MLKLYSMLWIGSHFFFYFVFYYSSIFEDVGGDAENTALLKFTAIIEPLIKNSL